MANATLTPSGKYRCQVYIGTDADGKRKYKVFTDTDKRRCERKASEFADEHRVAKNSDEIGHAIEHYITIKEAVLSPSTIRGYEAINRTIKTSYSAFYERRMATLDKDTLQEFVNDLLMDGKKPKTIRNMVGLVTAVIDYNDYHVPKTRLPERKKPDLHIPDTKDVAKIIKEAEGTEMEIPVLLAAFAPMRRSEICALTLDDISGTTIHVRRAMVLSPHDKFVTKGTKTYDSDRYIPMQKEIIDKIIKKGCITNIKTPGGLTTGFERIAEKVGCKGTRFHDLRHWCASYLHAKGVPDQYIMIRGGWKTDRVMKAVYTHELASESDKWNKQIDKYFEEAVKLHG